MEKYSLEENFNYFIANHDEILKQYPNKFVVIQNKQVIFGADTFDEAFSEANSRGLETGTYIIQECSEGDSAYTQTFHSRAIFV